MIKQITTKYLRKIGACGASIAEFENQTETDPIKVLLLCLKSDRWDWANWLITRLMTHKQQVQYAVHAAEMIIDEQKLSCPIQRQTIDAAKKWLHNPSKENRKVAYVVADAAYAVAEATAYYAYHSIHPFPVAADAIYAAAYAAYSVHATNRSDVAANTAYTASTAAYTAAYAVALCLQSNLRKKIIQSNLRKKIINYGIKLLKAM